MATVRPRASDAAKASQPAWRSRRPLIPRKKYTPLAVAMVIMLPLLKLLRDCSRLAHTAHGGRPHTWCAATTSKQPEPPPPGTRPGRHAPAAAPAPIPCSSSSATRTTWNRRVGVSSNQAPASCGQHGPGQHQCDRARTMHGAARPATTRAQDRMAQTPMHAQHQQQVQIHHARPAGRPLNPHPKATMRTSRAPDTRGAQCAARGVVYGAQR